MGRVRTSHFLSKSPLPVSHSEHSESLQLPMAQRGKCSPELAENDKAPLATFKRRSNCLLKKASELSTLCDVDVAVLIYADHLSDGPLVYPPESVESLRIIKKWKENRRCVPAAKKKPDNFLNQANQGCGPSDQFCDDIASLNSEELNSLLRVLEAKEAEVGKKIDAMNQSNIMDEKTASRDWGSFSEGSEGENLAAVVHDQEPDTD